MQFITSSFLKSLVGLTHQEAKDRIEQAGLMVWTFAYALANEKLNSYPDRVILWTDKDGWVILASAGDQKQVVNDI